jgi:hypothetical protein
MNSFAREQGKGRHDGFIHVRGATENNLQNVEVRIPRDSIVAFTGVSGSGKSSLAFGTIFAESQRRFLATRVDSSPRATLPKLNSFPACHPRWPCSNAVVLPAPGQRWVH